MHRAFSGFGAGEFAAAGERKDDICADSLPRKELFKFLENEHAVGSGSMDCRAIEKDASLDGIYVSADGLQNRRLSASGWPENHETIRSEDVKANTIDRGDQMVPGSVLQCEVLGCQKRGHNSASGSRVDFWKEEVLP